MGWTKAGRLITTICILAGCVLAFSGQTRGQSGTGTLTGRVVDPQGVEIAGVRVTAFDDRSQRIFETTTDCSGFYLFSGLNPGKYTVKFGIKGFRTETRDSVGIEWGQATELNMKLEVGQFTDWAPTMEVSSGPLLSGTIRGIVSDTTGATIAGAHVTATVEITGQQTEAISDSAGKYQLSLGPYYYGVRFAARGYKTETKTHVLLENGGVTELSVHLAAASGEEIRLPSAMEPEQEAAKTPFSGAIHGAVTDAKGVVPARITATELSTHRRFETTTDSNGEYRLFDLPAGSYCARFEAAGPRMAAWWPKYESSGTVKVDPGRTADLDLSVPVEKDSLVEVCSGCLIETLNPSMQPAHPAIRLQAYARQNVVYPGAELWLTVYLTNISKHSVSIPIEDDRERSFAYEIHAFGKCGCPGQLHIPSEKQARSTRGKQRYVRLKPGKSLINRIDLSKLMDLKRPSSYAVQVRCADPMQKPQGADQKWIASEPITIAVMARDSN